MNPGDDMQNRSTAERTLHALKPAALDETAGDLHDRRRADDLARIMQVAQEPAARRSGMRRPAVLLAGVAAAACAATGTVVMADGGAAPVPAPPAAAAPKIDARSFLLASAEKAAEAPAEVGRYWYTETTTTSLSNMKIGTFGEGDRKRKVKVPYEFEWTRGQETWTARSGDDRSRTITGLDIEIAFPTAEDEAAWKRAGSEQLVAPEQRGSVNNYDIPLHYSIGDGKLTMEDLRKLPTDAAALETELRERYETDANRDPEGPWEKREMVPFSTYVFSVAHDLLDGPITPGTRAALYRVLAEQPDVRSEGVVKDPLGRAGVALSMSYDGDYESDGAGTARLIIAKDSAELLAYESGHLSVAYQEAGWVDELGARP